MECTPKSKNYCIVSLPMPFMGETISEGVILWWYVRQSDAITKGSILSQIEIDNTTWDSESPCDGEVIKQHGSEGDIIEAGYPFIEIKKMTSIYCT